MRIDDITTRRISAAIIYAEALNWEAITIYANGELACGDDLRSSNKSDYWIGMIYELVDELAERGA